MGEHARPNLSVTARCGPWVRHWNRATSERLVGDLRPYLGSVGPFSSHHAQCRLLPGQSGSVASPRPAQLVPLLPPVDRCALGAISRILRTGGPNSPASIRTVSPSLFRTARSCGLHLPAPARYRALENVRAESTAVAIGHLSRANHPPARSASFSPGPLEKFLPRWTSLPMAIGVLNSAKSRRPARREFPPVRRPVHPVRSRVSNRPVPILRCPGARFPRWRFRYSTGE